MNELLGLSHTAKQFARACVRQAEDNPRPMVWQGVVGWWSYDGIRIDVHASWHSAMRLDT